jgi:peptidoglycan/xylan/chitin deacetylase (PgdA/CDA1 family)
MTIWTKGGVARAKAATAPGSLDREEALVIGYLSPEEARGRTVDPRSDSFAFGVVLYKMLTGRQPFAAATPDLTIANVLGRTPKRPSAVNPDLPAELDGIVMKLLAKELDSRYQTAAAIASDLRRVNAELDRRMTERLHRGAWLRRRRVLTGAAIATVILVLTHTVPAPGPFDVMAGPRAVWHMPRTSPPTVYLTYDDGPNAATTPALLDVLAREQVRATFFLVDREITDRTVPLVARMFAEGHSVALHSDSRLDLLMSPAAFARKLAANADRIERLTGHRPVRAFRPHAGWRSAAMYAGLKRIDYRLIGWGWMRWDWNWYRTRTADATVDRVAPRIEPGDIVVMHDGNVYKPGEDQRHTVEATARLIPLLRARGYAFGRF